MSIQTSQILLMFLTAEEAHKAKVEPSFRLKHDRKSMKIEPSVNTVVKVLYVKRLSTTINHLFTRIMKLEIIIPKTEGVPVMWNPKMVASLMDRLSHQGCRRMCN